jgi:glycosyltransferase involved in cell wall biosynthesis
MNRITIIVLCYNNERYIEECLESIISQPLNDYEVIISDDCSTDGSREVISNFISKNKRLSSDWILNINNVNVGVNKSILKCANLSKSNWIKVIAGDDVFSTGALKAYSDLANLHDYRSSIIMTSVDLIDEKSSLIGIRKPISSHLYSNRWLREVNLYINTVIAPSILVGKKNLIYALNETKTKNAEDWPILRYFIFKELNFILPRESLVCYRIHRASISAKYHFNKSGFSNKIRTDVITILNENKKEASSLFTKFGIYIQLLHQQEGKSRVYYYAINFCKLLNIQLVIFKLILKITRG